VSVEQFVEGELAEKSRYSKKTCPSVALSTTEAHRISEKEAEVFGTFMKVRNVSIMQ
jgi:hypothetical protein